MLAPPGQTRAAHKATPSPSPRRAPPRSASRAASKLFISHRRHIAGGLSRPGFFMRICPTAASASPNALV